MKALSELLMLHETVILGLDLSAGAAFSGRPVSSPMSVGKTLARREMVDMFKAAGIEVFYLRQRFSTYVAEQPPRWVDAAKEAGVEPQ